MQVINSVVFSLLVFYVVRLRGAYTVFWLVYLITSCCGVSALQPLHINQDRSTAKRSRQPARLANVAAVDTSTVTCTLRTQLQRSLGYLTVCSAILRRTMPLSDAVTTAAPVVPFWSILCEPTAHRSQSAACACAVIAYFIAALAPTMEVANAAVPAYVGGPLIQLLCCCC